MPTLDHCQRVAQHTGWSKPTRHPWESGLLEKPGVPKVEPVQIWTVASLKLPPQKDFREWNPSTQESMWVVQDPSQLRRPGGHPPPPEAAFRGQTACILHMRKTAGKRHEGPGTGQVSGKAGAGEWATRVQGINLI